MDYKVILFLIFGQFSFSQTIISGVIKNIENEKPLIDVNINSKELKTSTDINGLFSLKINQVPTSIIIEKEGFETIRYNITQNVDTLLIYLQPIINLNEIELVAHQKQEFALRRMKDIEGTTIMAGKKNEVVLLNQLTVNKATNNARQIYGQIVGLNIFDYNDGGLQLAIGGRGLNPNRSENFNTRQNNYDISADVLGYPESYYTPPAEALEEIQIIRGAASLQYGTQFGGLINFKFRNPPKNKKLSFITRNTIGSNKLYTNFSSLAGTVNKIGYYTFFNYKNGSSFRPNSNFESKNYFGHIDYNISENTKIAFEYTHFDYLAQQAGGLTDYQFNLNPNYSNRKRNWFNVDWNLYDFNITHKFSNNSRLSTHFFGLSSRREALGFRSNRVSQEDENTQPRDLLKGDFKNWGIESRYLSDYKLFDKKHSYLIGTKFYKANNNSEQGPGTRTSDPNFNYDYTSTPNYPYQSKFNYPNKNLAIFGETMFNITDKLSITPGFRYEWINTQADGYYKNIELDLAGNILFERKDEVKIERKRDFALVGIGFSYKVSNIDFYSNISENYRSVTFNDIHTVSPNRFVSDDISDEKGFNFDIGARGKIKDYISFDTNIFTLLYDNRIGDYIRSSDGKRGRDNIGKATIYGLELFWDFDLDEILGIPNNNYSITYFINSAFTHSEYTSSDVQSADIINGNKVEYVPKVNVKSGLGFGYKNFTSQLIGSYLSKQFTDAGNTESSPDPINGGIVGPIPSYFVMDLSAAYRYKRYKLEFSLNNLLNKDYFVRRASGYPGPGIIPSEPFNWSLTFEIKL